jgi:putative hydrolase of the HAD superfamily
MISDGINTPANVPGNAPALSPSDWARVETVLLDLDGTLLDLAFDNYFWRTRVPEAWARSRCMSPEQARAELQPRFRAREGTLDWYCIDYWSRELGLDIAALKRAARPQVSYLPGAREFLSWLERCGRRRILLTNAHPETLAIKNEQVGLTAYFDACYSTHTFGTPKEHAEFWPRFHAHEPFRPERTLFVDDSLPVLDAARAFGIGWLCAVRLPDSGRPAQDTGPYAAVDGVRELM